MSKFLRTNRIVKTLVVVTGVSAGLYAIKSFVYDEDKGERRTESRRNHFLPEINASWTTDFTPSIAWDHNWDRRQPSSLKKPAKREAITTDINNNVDTEKELTRPKSTRHLILVRHGQYQSSAKKDADQVLTVLGREQANLTGARLKELAFPYTSIVNSTMTRAVETAAIVAKYLPDVKTSSSDLIREGAPIPPEPPVGHWRPELHQFYRDGSRIEAAFREFFHRADVDQEQDSYEILVCHANVIRFFVCRALQFPPEAWLRISLHHASITWLTIRPSGRVSLYTLGDCGHLPPDKLSYH